MIISSEAKKSAVRHQSVNQVKEQAALNVNDAF